MRENKNKTDVRVATTKEMLDAVVLVDCTPSFIPSSTIIHRSIRSTVCSVCGKPINVGDFYYYLNNRGGFISCSDCAPVAYRNRVYVRNHDVAVSALATLHKKPVKIAIGDLVEYKGTAYRVNSMEFFGNLRAPFCVLYNEQTRMFYQDEHGAYLAVSVVALKKVKEN